MTLPRPIPGSTLRHDGPLVDRFGRAHTYVRISVTDRCNYRCTYCLPEEGLVWLPRKDVLAYEEIARIVRVFASLGVRRIRLTGGEPTVRRDLALLVEAIGKTPGIEDLAMTTNGHKLAPMAGGLAEAGLRRVNVSCDSVDSVAFREITRGGDLAKVLEGIEAARAARLTPIKINAVMVAGLNEDSLFTLVEHFAPHARDTQVRFIEAMPFETTARTHLPTAEMRRRLEARWGLDPVEAPQGGGPATHARVRGLGLLVGFISPMTEHFCQACNRLRLSADGGLRTCLSRDDRPSLRDLLRGGASDDDLAIAIREQVWGKVAGHEAHLDSSWRPFEGVMTRIGG